MTEGRKKVGRHDFKDPKDFKDLKDLREPRAREGAAKFRAESAGIANIH